MQVPFQTRGLEFDFRPFFVGRVITGSPAMSSINSIALSGMNAAQVQLDTAAGNVANAQTPGYRRREVQQSPQADGGVATQVVRSAQTGDAPLTDVVAQLQAKNAFLANLAVFKTNNAMAGALLNKKA
jgi:flagellar hook protein FlgE